MSEDIRGKFMKHPCALRENNFLTKRWGHGIWGAYNVYI